MKKFFVKFNTPEMGRAVEAILLERGYGWASVGAVKVDFPIVKNICNSLESAGGAKKYSLQYGFSVGYMEGHQTFQAETELGKFIDWLKESENIKIQLNNDYHVIISDKVEVYNKNNHLINYTFSDILKLENLSPTIYIRDCVIKVGNAAEKIAAILLLARLGGASQDVVGTDYFKSTVNNERVEEYPYICLHGGSVECYGKISGPVHIKHPITYDFNRLPEMMKRLQSNKAIKLGQYDATTDGDNVKIGCQSFSRAKIKEVIDAIKSLDKAK